MPLLLKPSMSKRCRWPVFLSAAAFDKKPYSMKKLIILFALCIFSGCSYFNQTTGIFPVTGGGNSRLAVLVGGNSNCRNFVQSGALALLIDTLKAAWNVDSIVQIKRYQSGSSLKKSPSFDWDKTSEDEHWEKFVKKWDFQKHRAEQDGQNLVLMAFINIQGGKDIIDSTAHEYYKHLSVLDYDIREYTGFWSMRHIVTRVRADFDGKPNDPQLALSRQAVEILASEHPFVDIIDTDDTEAETDNRHYTDAGQYQNLEKFLNVLF